MEFKNGDRVITKGCVFNIKEEVEIEGVFVGLNPFDSSECCLFITDKDDDYGWVFDATLYKVSDIKKK